jgi:hypothetical protein
MTQPVSRSMTRQMHAAFATAVTFVVAIVFCEAAAAKPGNFSAYLATLPCDSLSVPAVRGQGWTINHAPYGVPIDEWVPDDFRVFLRRFDECAAKAGISKSEMGYVEFDVNMARLRIEGAAETREEVRREKERLDKAEKDRLAKIAEQNAMLAEQHRQEVAAADAAAGWDPAIFTNADTLRAYIDALPLTKESLPPLLALRSNHNLDRAAPIDMMVSGTITRQQELERAIEKKQQLIWRAVAIQDADKIRQAADDAVPAAAQTVATWGIPDAVLDSRLYVRPEYAAAPAPFLTLREFTALGMSNPVIERLAVFQGNCPDGECVILDVKFQGKPGMKLVAQHDLHDLFLDRLIQGDELHPLGTTVAALVMRAIANLSQEEIDDFVVAAGALQ